MGADRPPSPAGPPPAGPPPADRPPPPAGPLRPVELATAAVLGGITVALAVAGWLLPHASAVQAMGTVPMALVAHRHRPRAVVAAAFAGCVVSFLVAGTGPAYSVVLCAVIGGEVGDIKRRGRGPWTAVAVTAVVAPALACLVDGLLAVFKASRVLTLDQIRNLVHGITGTAARVPALAVTAHHADLLLVTALRHWWIAVGAATVAFVAVSVWVAWVLVGAVVDRLAWMAPEDRLEGGPEPGALAPVLAPVPVPVTLRGVRHRYPGAATDALCDIDLDIPEGALVALVGANGSGKSTLARILAGRPPTGGEVVRAGGSGLGRPGGTALVAQRPESQVLGVRVGDDLVWGLPPRTPVDVEGLLATVGLGGMAGRDTATLSGGELQRVAVAAALARRPRLLLSDESTAMVDQDGRRQLTELLARLPHEHPMTVVHVTHRAEEAAMADRIVHLSGGRVVEGGSEGYLAVEDPPSTGLPAGGGAVVLRAVDVSHTYAAGTPWAQPALHHVDLDVHEGDGLLVVGGNGSGKSTLAWVLAGLLRPSEGTCLLGGAPVATRVGAVGLSFQHARLQLQRPTVGADIRAAAGIGREEVPAALAEVGLDEAFAPRPIDQLSGGEMRRVALAGLLARRPRVLLLDEPLAGLDPPSRRTLLDLLRRQRQQGLALVVISHDLEGMAAVCDRTARLERGRLSVGGPPAAPAPGAAVRS